jgi:hypothetical protein
MTGLQSERLEAPDYVEPLTAWRVWRVVATGDGYRLTSVVKSALWSPGEPLHAECLREPSLVSLFRRHPKKHEAPEERCDCGIYAGGLPLIGNYMTPAATEAVTHVLGQVMLWGTVVECERGFRASHAYPACLYVPYGGDVDGGRESLVAALGVYGVPVEPLDASPSEAVRTLERLRRTAETHVSP